LFDLGPKPEEKWAKDRDTERKKTTTRRERGSHEEWSATGAMFENWKQKRARKKSEIVAEPAFLVKGHERIRNLGCLFNSEGGGGGTEGNMG